VAACLPLSRSLTARIRRVLAASHARWKNLSLIRGSGRHGHVRRVKFAYCSRICCRRDENRSKPRNAYRNRDARQPWNVKPECHEIALRREYLLSPEPPQAAPAVLQERILRLQEFAWERCLEFPSIRRRYRTRFRPAELSSRNFRPQPTSFRRLLPCSISTASCL
jgi:hypothetical protein